MEDFRADVAALAGSDAVAMKALETAEVGQVWIQNCEGELQKKAELAIGRLDSEPQVDQSNLGNLSVEVEWLREGGTEASFAFKIVEAAIGAAFKDSRVESLLMKIELGEPVLESLRDPAPVMNMYTAIAFGEIEGNVMVTGVIRSQLRLEYEILDEDNRELNVDLTVPMNEFADAGNLDAGYVYNASGTSTTRIVQESPSGTPTVFAAILRNVPQAAQNQAKIAEQVDLVCEQPGAVPVTRLIGYDQTTGETIAAFEFEETVSTTVLGDRENRVWFLRVENLSGERLAVLDYVLRVRNAYGQAVGTVSGLIIDMADGAIVDRGRVIGGPNTEGTTRVPLDQAEFEITLDYRLPLF